ncbi:general stress protein [Georgenia phoenicis]|uniref:general stress protein n=1 Tax=unclassified Georgenia TaxID=2626815 RepID=UPI0039AF30A7
MSELTGTTRTEYRTLSEVPDYAQAQRLVDHLSDSGFPVEHVRIVGTGIRSVEQVTGRQTKARAAGMGAAAGAWWGLLIGLLFSFFVIGGWLVMILTAVAMGAVGGALVGFVGHWASGGRRDFTSIRGMEATSYEVQVAAPFHGQAVAAAGLR